MSEIKNAHRKELPNSTLLDTANATFPKLHDQLALSAVVLSSSPIFGSKLPGCITFN